ncbi:MAG: hypothetical protein R3F61_39055 [Myxococcota bacterium]
MERLQCPEPLRTRVIDAWTTRGRRAHGRIATTARFVLGAMADGAPLELVADLGIVQLDHVHHAQRCLALAAGLGAVHDPSPLSVVPADPPSAASPTELAQSCIEATVRAVAWMEARDAARQTDVRELFDTLASDASRHVEVMWRLLRWTLGRADTVARAAVVDALRAWGPSAASATPEEVELAAFGALSPRLRNRAEHRALPIVQQAADAWA